MAEAHQGPPLHSSSLKGPDPPLYHPLRWCKSCPGRCQIQPQTNLISFDDFNATGGLTSTHTSPTAPSPQPAGPSPTAAPTQSAPTQSNPSPSTLATLRPGRRSRDIRSANDRPYRPPPKADGWLGVLHFSPSQQ